MKPVGFRIKLKNRRILAYRDENLTWKIEFKRLGDRQKRQIIITPLILSEEAYRQLVYGYLRVNQW